MTRGRGGGSYTYKRVSLTKALDREKKSKWHHRFLARSDRRARARATSPFLRWHDDRALAFASSSLVPPVAVVWAMKIHAMVGGRINRVPPCRTLACPVYVRAEFAARHRARVS